MNDRVALSINDWCRWSGIGRTKTYQLISDGHLPIVKIGKKTLIRTSDGEALLEKFRQISPTSKMEAAN
jgi:excisionase family DNA binding protein